jgi:predicted nucleotidyltransferase
LIRYSKLPDNIEHLLPVAQAYMKSRKDVLFAYLFGGLARGKTSPLSDVDIAICLSEDVGALEKKMEIQRDGYPGKEILTW